MSIAPDNLFIDTGFAQCCHYAEKACGDAVAFKRIPAEERLIGAVIVGTGLPQVCSDREIIRSFFDKKNMEGFSYSYLYPGMNKVLQSAGRVIRTERDRGVILLLDERFQDQRYREIFPREWTGVHTCSIPTLQCQLEDFWK